MKKEKSPILVISCIFLLLIFIVVPPLFRGLFPKEKEPIEVPQKQKAITSLNCSRVFGSELYRVSVRVKYVDDLIVSNTITYQKLEALPENHQEATSTVSYTMSEEYNHFSNLEGIEKKAEIPNPIFVITSDTIESNPEDQVLKSYFQEDSSMQQKFYEERGFTCNLFTS